MPASELDDIRARLEKAERETDLVAKATELTRALDDLRDYEEDEATDRERVVIGNIRQSYARRLLEQLGGVQKASLDSWTRYAVLLVDKLKPEVRAALAADPALEENLKRFLAMTGDEFGAHLRAQIGGDG